MCLSNELVRSAGSVSHCVSTSTKAACVTQDVAICRLRTRFSANRCWQFCPPSPFCGAPRCSWSLASCRFECALPSSQASRARTWFTVIPSPMTAVDAITQMALYICFGPCDKILPRESFTTTGWEGVIFRAICKDCEPVPCHRCKQAWPRGDLVHDGAARGQCRPCFAKRRSTQAHGLLTGVRRQCRKRKQMESAHWGIEDVELLLALWQQPAGLPPNRIPRLRVVPMDASRRFTPVNAMVVLLLGD
jgi:hypothetical protein